MNEQSTQGYRSRTWIKPALVGLLVGAALTGLLFALSSGVAGAGHGTMVPASLTAGPSGLTFAMLPLAWAGISSRQPGAMCAALASEVIHNLWAFATDDGFSGLVSAGQLLKGHSMGGTFFLWLALYVLAHGYVWVGFLLPWKSVRSAGGLP